MKKKSLKFAAGAMLLAAAGIVFSDGPGISWARLALTVPNLAPAGTPGGTTARTAYRAGWSATSAASPKGPHVHYCVTPFVQTTGPAGGASGSRSAPPWTQPFEISLVDAAGRPADPRFRAVRVPVPIPADTTLELRPVPPWCGEVAGARTPPELYLQVAGSRERARVVFDRAPASPPPR